MEPWWVPRMREVFGGRRVILLGVVAAAWVDHVERLRGVGVEDFLIVAPGGRGVGPVPDVPTVELEPPAHLSLMEQLHYGNHLFRNPTPEIRTALDDFDPDRTAVVLGSFLNEVPEVDGRPVMAHRRPAWVALEDKVVIDEFWDQAGVPRQPSVIVPLAEATEAAAEMDGGAGTVWSADAREGFHGGGTRTFWVADESSRCSAVEALTPVCDSVRVMPFVDGVPCSIHGIVLPDGVVSLRPVEMITLRRGTDLVYAGCATFWDPPREIRESMRGSVRRAGEHLRAEVGFRGTFTIDGVAAEDGFWPTEMNPRYGAGIMTITRAGGRLPMLLLNDLIVGGHDIGRSAADLEAELVGMADEIRGGGTWMPGATPTVSTEGRDVTEQDGVWRWSADGDPAAGTVISGARFVRCTYPADTVPVGPSTQARAASFWRFADEQLGTELGALTPPPDPFF
jgi:hypothetical protein